MEKAASQNKSVSADSDPWCAHRGSTDDGVISDCSDSSENDSYIDTSTRLYIDDDVILGAQDDVIADDDSGSQFPGDTMDDDLHKNNASAEKYSSLDKSLSKDDEGIAENVTASTEGHVLARTTSNDDVSGIIDDHSTVLGSENDMEYYFETRTSVSDDDVYVGHSKPSDNRQRSTSDGQIEKFAPRLGGLSDERDESMESDASSEHEFKFSEYNPFDKDEEGVSAERPSTDENDCGIGDVSDESSGKFTAGNIASYELSGSPENALSSDSDSENQTESPDSAENEPETNLAEASNSDSDSDEKKDKSEISLSQIEPELHEDEDLLAENKEDSAADDDGTLVDEYVTRTDDVYPGRKAGYDVEAENSAQSDASSDNDGLTENDASLEDNLSTEDDGSSENLLLIENLASSAQSLSIRKRVSFEEDFPDRAEKLSETCEDSFASRGCPENKTFLQSHGTGSDDASHKDMSSESGSSSSAETTPYVGDNTGREEKPSDTDNESDLPTRYGSDSLQVDDHVTEGISCENRGVRHGETVHRGGTFVHRTAGGVGVSAMSPRGGPGTVMSTSNGPYAPRQNVVAVGAGGSEVVGRKDVRGRGSKNGSSRGVESGSLSSEITMEEELQFLRAEVRSKSIAVNRLQTSLYDQQVRANLAVVALRTELRKKTLSEQQQRDKQEEKMGALLSHLLYLEGQMREEQRRVLELLHEKDDVIRRQKSAIDDLTGKNNKLLEALREVHGYSGGNGVASALTASSASSATPSAVDGSDNGTVGAVVAPQVVLRNRDAGPKVFIASSSASVKDRKKRHKSCLEFNRPSSMEILLEDNGRSGSQENLSDSVAYAESRNRDRKRLEMGSRDGGMRPRLSDRQERSLSLVDNLSRLNDLVEVSNEGETGSEEATNPDPAPPPPPSPPPIADNSLQQPSSTRHLPLPRRHESVYSDEDESYTGQQGKKLFGELIKASSMPLTLSLASGKDNVQPNLKARPHSLPDAGLSLIADQVSLQPVEIVDMNPSPSPAPPLPTEPIPVSMASPAGAESNPFKSIKNVFKRRSSKQRSKKRPLSMGHVGQQSSQEYQETLKEHFRKYDLS